MEDPARRQGACSCTSVALHGYRRTPRGAAYSAPAADELVLALAGNLRLPPALAESCRAFVPQVKIIAGKDKGQTGTIARVLRDQNRVVVEGYNLARAQAAAAHACRKP